MRAALHSFRLAIVLFLSVATLAHAQVLDDVKVSGNSRVEDETILLQVSSKSGTNFDAQLVGEDVKEIYRTGFFEEVIAQLEPTSAGHAALVFQVQEKRAIRHIYLEGNEEITDETLTEKLNLSARKFLDRGKLFAGIRSAKAFYQDQGFYGTEITYDVTEVDDNQVDLSFTVVDGVEKTIEEVTFEGNSFFNNDELAEEIQTSDYSWWRSWITGEGTLKKDVVNNDSRALTQFYLKHGFVDIRVSEPEIREEDDDLIVVFKISEGEAYRFNKITASGSLLEDSEKLTLAGIGTKSGEVFNVDNLRGDTFAITEKFTSIGYAFANVEPLTDINREERLVNIDFRIDQGKLIRINRILISGNTKTEDRVVRRSLKIQEREIFSSAKINRSQQLLQRLGYFDEVTITPDPSVAEDEVDLNVSVREGQTGSFSAGAGVSSGDGFIITGKIEERNLYGSGNSLSMNVNTGASRENYVLSFSNPRLNDTWWSMGVDILSVSREFDDFDRDQAGGSLTVGYPLVFLGPEYLEDIRFSTRYELLKINITDVDADAPQLIKDQEGRSTSSSLTPALSRNTIDNPLDPTDGMRTRTSMEVAGLGGDEEFWLYQLSNTIYKPVLDTPYGPFVVSQRFRLGYGKTYDGDDFPLFRRFFPGGINSVRGYEARSMGPKNEEGDEFGGSKQLILNFDLIFPLVPQAGIKGVVFYDIGEAFDDNEDIEFSEMRAAVGWGIRWRSPIAPIRIEIGYPLDREDGDKSVVTNFSFGSPL